MSDEKRKGECDGCGKNPRVLRRIDSGHWVCQTCRREVKGPTKSRKGLATDRQIERGRELGLDISEDTARPVAADLIRQHEPATPKQIDYARKLGFDVDESMTKVKATELLDQHDSVKWYVYGVWKEIAGKTPKECGVPFEDIKQLFCDVIVRHGLGKRIDDIETRRYDEACDISNYRESKGEDVDFKECMPPRVRDGTFDVVAELLRQRYANHLPSRGFLGRLFGRP